MCCQLFVTDKGFIYVVLMKFKKEFLQAVKQCAWEIGAPDDIIDDAAGEKLQEPFVKFVIRLVLPCGCWRRVHPGSQRLSCILGS